MRTQPTQAGFEDERRASPQKCEQPLEAGKGKEKDIPTGLQKGMQPY